MCAVLVGALRVSRFKLRWRWWGECLCVESGVVRNHLQVQFATFLIRRHNPARNIRAVRSVFLQAQASIERGICELCDRFFASAS